MVSLATEMLQAMPEINDWDVSSDAWNAAENAVSSVGNLQENEKEITFAKSWM